jgi:hypothetical protein
LTSPALTNRGGASPTPTVEKQSQTNPLRLNLLTSGPYLEKDKNKPIASKLPFLNNLAGFWGSILQFLNGTRNLPPTIEDGRKQTQTNPLNLSHLSSVRCSKNGQNKPIAVKSLIIKWFNRFWGLILHFLNGCRGDAINEWTSTADFGGFSSGVGAALVAAPESMPFCHLGGHKGCPYIEPG